MARKAKKLTPNKTNTAKTPADIGDYTGTALSSLAQEVGGIAEELRPLYHIESISDNIGELASALRGLADATAMSVIAKNGNEEDGAVAVEHLKRRFEDFRK